MSRQAFDSAKELALELSESERAELASALVASLDGPPDPDAEQLWEREIVRRLEKNGSMPIDRRYKHAIGYRCDQNRLRAVQPQDQ